MEFEKDDLEKFIEQNKHAFNDEGPSADLWNKIEQQVEEKTAKSTSVPILSILWKAAIVVLIAGGAAYLLLNNNQVIENQQVQQVDSTEQEQAFKGKLREVSPELAEVEHFYYTEIEARMAEARALEVSDELLDHVTELDAEYEELQKELAKGMDSERIIQAMIQNYRTKLELLENILQEIKKQKEIIKQREDENNNNVS